MPRLIPDDLPPEPDNSKVWFFISSVFEAGLILAAWFIAAIAGVPLWADFRWDAMDGLKGVAAAVPPALIFVWSCSSPWPPVRAIHGALEAFARPIFGQFSTAQLLVISLIAGVAEEALFRAALQGGMIEPLGEIGALLTASALFGLAHLVTPGYAIGAAIMGGYLGWIWMQGGNLLIPITTHAVYDFVALMWFVNKTRDFVAFPDEE